MYKSQLDVEWDCEGTSVDEESSSDGLERGGVDVVVLVSLCSSSAAAADDIGSRVNN